MSKTHSFPRRPSFLALWPHPLKWFSKPHPPLLCSGSVHFSSASLPQAWERSCPTLASNANMFPSLTDQGPVLLSSAHWVFRTLQAPPSIMQSLEGIRPLFLSSLWAVGGTHRPCPHPPQLCRPWLGWSPALCRSCVHQSYPLEIQLCAVPDLAGTHSQLFSSCRPAPPTQGSGIDRGPSRAPGLLGFGNLAVALPSVANTLPDPLVWRDCTEQHSLDTRDSD